MTKVLISIDVAAECVPTFRSKLNFNHKLYSLCLSFRCSIIMSNACAHKAISASVLVAFSKFRKFSLCVKGFVGAQPKSEIFFKEKFSTERTK